MYCENCGKGLKEDNKFCPYCGAVNNFFENTPPSNNASAPIQNIVPVTSLEDRPKKKKLKTWKKILITVSAVVLALVVVVSAYFLTCFFFHNPYKTETDMGKKVEYYFGDKLSDRIRITYNEFDDIEFISKREKKVIDNNNCVIDSTEHYEYDDSRNLQYKSGTINGEPGIYEHKYIIDAQDKYISNEIWRLGENENEIIIEDSANNTKTKRYYEEYEVKEDDSEYLSNSDRLILLSSGGVTTDETPYFSITRLTKEEYTDNTNPQNSYVSTIVYGNDKIVEERINTGGNTNIIEYDLTGQEINNYWTD